MRGSAAVSRRIEFDRFDGVTPTGPLAAVPAPFERRPCDLSVATRAGRVPVRQSAGRGPAVLLLHGAGASKEAFRHQFDGALAQGHRLIAADLPDGPFPDETRAVRQGAALAAEVLDRLGVEGAPVAVGWGRGAGIALALALDRPLAGVVVTGAPLRALAEGIGRARGAGVPVAAIQGGEDPTLERGGSTDAMLWRRTGHVIPRAGHAPFLDGSDVFNHILALFVGEVARG